MLPNLIPRRSRSSSFIYCFWGAVSWDLSLTLLGLSCAVYELLPKLTLAAQQKCGQSRDLAIKLPVGTHCVSSCGAGASVLFLTQLHEVWKREP